ncbi:response regulator receiver protein [Sporocytophaga myxococcoides]|uniref:Response regulator receiver protein n=1 Tax=Sporocytophaga myxococcoides TaxID=153721 RepID=A0A098LB60_9BACT|nr:response regulator [Sporocytophaga myxococcoides]GAL83674.1 response regulator receiver protein [Sporocytophaga myxococcoides]
MKIRILYLDDEEYNRKAFYANFRNRYEIQLCASNKEVLDLLQQGNQYDIIILDQFKPDITGFDFLYNIKLHYEPVRIVITAYKDSRTLKEARREGDIFDFHFKPWLTEELEDIIQRAVNYINWKQNVIP